jgi:hypothetical protein
MMQAPPPPADICALLELSIRRRPGPAERSAIRALVGLLIQTADSVSPSQFSSVLLALARYRHADAALNLAEHALEQGWLPDDKSVVAVRERSTSQIA